VLQRQTAAATQRPAQVVAVRPLLDRIAEPRNALTILVLFLGIVALFWRWFWAQHQHSWGNGDWSHAYLVPLICVYLLWQNRDGLERARTAIFWPGVLPLVMGVWCYVYFIVGVPNHFGQGLALILTVFGLTLLFLGPRAMEHLFTAIAFLVFGITVPEIIMNYLTYPLQDLAARGGFFILRLINVNCDLSGNLITVVTSSGDTVPLDVGQQCSGMRTVIAFLALGSAVALVGTRTWWKRVVLVLTALPIAIVLNAMRIATLGVLSLYNPKFSQGQMHMFIGTLLLVPGFFLYLGVLWALNKAVPEDDQPDEKPVKVIAA
jgi:exosortase